MYLLDYRAETRAGTGPNSKPELNDDLLMHYGMRGMKWGVRKGKGTTGVGRFRGALLDRNARDTKMLKDARKGTGHLLPRAAAGLGKTLLGEKRWEKNFQKRMTHVNAQNQRLKKGKLTIADRIDMTLNVGAFDLVVSHTPKKK